MSKFLGVLAVAAALLVVPVGVASADKAPSGQDEFAFEASGMKQLIKYYVKTYHVSRGEARRRLRVMYRVPNLTKTLVKDLGDGFTQTWFDNGTGNWVMEINSATDRRAANHELHKLGLEGSQLVEVAYNKDQLDRRLEVADDLLEAVIRKGDATVGIGEDGLDITVAKDISVADEQLVERVKHGSTVHTHITHSNRDSLDATPDSATCSHPYCSQIIAGTKWTNAAGSCTTAFPVSSPSLPGGLFILTAGHCLAGNSANWTTCYPVGNCHHTGTEVGGYYGGGDAGVLRIDNPWLYVEPYWVNWYDNSVNSVSGQVDAEVDWAICHQGVTSGSSCGTVTKVDRSVEYEDKDGNVVAKLDHMIEVRDACGLEGDSGGPWTVYNSNLAVGIQSGATRLETQVCGQFQYNYVEPIGRALSTLGVTLRTAP